MLQIIRTLGFYIGASQHNAIPLVVVLSHIHQEAVQHAPMTNPLEEGQILMEERDDRMNNILKEINRWN